VRYLQGYGCDPCYIRITEAAGVEYDFECHDFTISSTEFNFQLFGPEIILMDIPIR